MALRVVQWTVGRLGKHALRGAIEAPDLDLVGVYSANPEKRGKDAGELCGMGVVTGVAATDDRAALLALRPDCVLYTAVGEHRPREAVADLVEILSSGANVSSSSMLDLLAPTFVRPKVLTQLEEACTRGSSTLLTTGVDPGFSADAMAVAAFQLCRSINTVRVQELFVYGNHPDPGWALPYGFGQPEGAPGPILEHRLPTRYWGGAVHLLAQALDVDLDGLNERVERVYAEEAFDVPIGHMPKGSLVAVRFQVAGVVDGEERIIIEHVTRMRADVAPHWPSPAAGQGPIHRVEIDGDPSFVLDLELARMAGADHNEDTYLVSAARLLNAIPQLVAAAPGLVTPLDLQLGVGRNLLAPEHLARNVAPPKGQPQHAVEESGGGGVMTPGGASQT